jgi:hypothetical protein
VRKRPAWTKFLSIVVVIEGFELGPDAPAVRAELNRAAPHMYTRETRLGSVWHRLSDQTQVALVKAWEREKAGAVIPRERKAAS